MADAFPAESDTNNPFERERGNTKTYRSQLGMHLPLGGTTRERLNDNPHTL